MVSTTSLLAAGAAAVAIALPQADAHGALRLPMPENANGKSAIPWVVTLKPAWPWEGSGSWKGGDQAGMYSKLSKKNGFATLRSFIENKGPACGNTNPNASPRPVPSTNYAEFLGNGGGGFTHQGPCEIWLDNTRVFQNDNCEKGYPNKGKDATKLPVDYSSCKTKCMLRFFWLGFQNEEWQVYKNCVPLARTNARSMDVEEFDFSYLNTNSTSD